MAMKEAPLSYFSTAKYLLWCVARSHPVVHDDALIAGVALVVLLVPLGAHLVQAFLLVREHHRVHRLKAKRFSPQQWHVGPKYVHPMYNEICSTLLMKPSQPILF